MKIQEIYDELQKIIEAGKKAEFIVLYIHMPGEDEPEVIVNYNVKKKLEYLATAYTEDLRHKNNPDIYIENFLLCDDEENTMDFDGALIAMKEGAKVKLPDWGGYWCWDFNKETIMMHCKDGEVLDIRDTQRVEYTLQNICSDEWMIADEENCPLLGGCACFSFGNAIKLMKRGLKVARKGWNGKNQHIELAENISYVAPDGEIVNAEHDAIGNKAIAFVGTSGVQLGWLASQADMLAEDWVLVE